MSEAQIFFAEPSNLYRDQTDEHDMQVVFFADYIALENARESWEQKYASRDAQALDLEIERDRAEAKAIMLSDELTEAQDGYDALKRKRDAIKAELNSIKKALSIAITAKAEFFDAIVTEQEPGQPAIQRMERCVLYADYIAFAEQALAAYRAQSTDGGVK